MVALRGARSATRVLRLLLLLVLAECLIEGSLIALKWFPLRNNLHTPAYNVTQSTLRSGDKISINWTKPSSAHVKNTVLNTTNVSQSLTEKTLEGNSGTKNVTDQTEQSVKAYSGTTLFIAKIMNSIKKLVTTEEVVTEPPLPLCSKVPPGLGPMSVNQTELELDFVETKFPEIQFGGRYAPPNCTARHKVAIIVPYRDRREHLPIFLIHMHPFLMKQQIEYGIFIVEQEDKNEFNRGKLMNVGFVESLRLDRIWQCFVFHDIDLLPLDTHNLYTCPRQPRHMSACVSTRNYELPYYRNFGGASAMTLEQFNKVNGFSNIYWGWGGEDDDMYLRMKNVGYHIARYKLSIARYFMLGHKKAVPKRSVVQQRYRLVDDRYSIRSRPDIDEATLLMDYEFKSQAKDRQWVKSDCFGDHDDYKKYLAIQQPKTSFINDGLSTLEYRLEKVVQYHLYTHILVNIGKET